MKPELILLSAGFDAHAADPIGGLGLEVEDFVTMTEDVRRVAKTHASGRWWGCSKAGTTSRFWPSAWPRTWRPSAFIPSTIWARIDGSATTRMPSRLQ